MTRIVDAAGVATQLNSSPNGVTATPATLKEMAVAAEPLGESEAEKHARIREERMRLSLSVPQQKMKVPELPGFHTHWINDFEGRVQRAQRAGYQFVLDEEVKRFDYSFAGDSTKPGNSDLGSNVSMVVGTDPAGAPMRAYLMKIPQEIWEMDQSLLQERNDQISQALKRGRIGTDGVDVKDLPIAKTVEVSRPHTVIRKANPTDASKSI